MEKHVRLVVTMYESSDKYDSPSVSSNTYYFDVDDNCRLNCRCDTFVCELLKQFCDVECDRVCVTMLSSFLIHVYYSVYEYLKKGRCTNNFSYSFFDCFDNLCSLDISVSYSVNCD